MELCLHSPNMPSWCGAQLKKHRDNFTFTFYIIKMYFMKLYSCIGFSHKGSDSSLVKFSLNPVIFFPVLDKVPHHEDVHYA
jgi:hypothetical protein